MEGRPDVALSQASGMLLLVRPHVCECIPATCMGEWRGEADVCSDLSTLLWTGPDPAFSLSWLQPLHLSP